MYLLGKRFLLHYTRWGCGGTADRGRFGAYPGLGWSLDTGATDA